MVSQTPHQLAAEMEGDRSSQGGAFVCIASVLMKSHIVVLAEAGESWVQQWHLCAEVSPTIVQSTALAIAADLISDRVQGCPGEAKREEVLKIGITGADRKEALGRAEITAR